MESKSPQGFKVLSVLSILNLLLLFGGIYIFKIVSVLFTSFQPFQTPFDILPSLMQGIACILTLSLIKSRNSYLQASTLFSYVVVIFLLAVTYIRLGTIDYFGALLSFSPWIFFTWYIYEAREYFTNVKDPFNKAEKYVKVFLISWVLGLVAFSANTWIMGTVNKASQKKDAILFIENFKGKSYKERLAYCKTVDNKDLCFYFAFYETKNRSNITSEDCDLITKKEYRISCYSFANKCEEITEAKMLQACKMLREIPLQKR